MDENQDILLPEPVRLFPKPVRPAQRKEEVAGVVGAVRAVFLDIDEPVFEAGVKIDFVAGVHGEGKAYATGHADVEAFDAGGNVGVGGEVLGGDRVSLNSKGDLTFVVFIDNAGAFCLLNGMEEVARIEAGVGVELKRPAPRKFSQDGEFEIVQHRFVIKIRVQVVSRGDQLLVARGEVGDRLEAITLAALTGKIQFCLDGEPVVDMPFALDAKIGGKAGSIVAAELVAIAAAEIRDAEAAVDTQPGHLSESMASLKESQEREEADYFSHKKVDLIRKN
jgi:hypothetical protein